MEFLTSVTWDGLGGQIWGHSIQRVKDGRNKYPELSNLKNWEKLNFWPQWPQMASEVKIDYILFKGSRMDVTIVQNDQIWKIEKKWIFDLSDLRWPRSSDLRSFYPKGHEWPQKLSRMIKFEKLRKIEFLTSVTSDGLGGQIWGHPVTINRGRRATLESINNREKWLLPWLLPGRNQAWPHLTSEAAEADLKWPKTFESLSRGHMPSFMVLGWKLWPAIPDIPPDRRNRVAKYILRSRWFITMLSNSTLPKPTSFKVWRVSFLVSFHNFPWENTRPGSKSTPQTTGTILMSNWLN